MTAGNGLEVEGTEIPLECEGFEATEGTTLSEEVVEMVDGPEPECDTPPGLSEEEEAEQQKLQYKAEIKHFAAMLMSGYKANNSRSQGSNKDVEIVKECVKQAMLMVNYVNQLPLNFQTQQQQQQGQ